MMDTEVQSSEKNWLIEAFFKSGKKGGIGEERSEEGKYCKGEFYNGEKSGKSEYHFSDGTNYAGNFRNSLLLPRRILAPLLEIMKISLLLVK